MSGHGDRLVAGMLTVQAGSVKARSQAAPRPGESAARLRGAERQLAEAAERALRQPAGKVVVVLRLSLLAVPRAYHLRVARVLLQECAQRFAGQVFAMSNQDLVLLCAECRPEQAADPYAPERLPASLARLFAIDAPASGDLVALWRLERDPACLAQYLQARAEAGVPVAEPVAQGQPVSLAALEEIIARAPLAGLLGQQTGLSLSPDRGLPLARRLAPAFQHVAVGLDRLSLDKLVTHATADPFLLRHCTAVLDGRLLGVLQEDIQARGRLLRQASVQGLPVLVALGLRAIVSPAFATLARLAAAAGLRFWVAVSLLEAGADLDLLEHARGILKLTGCKLVIDQVEPAALRLARLEALRADLVVLAWSPVLRRPDSTAGLLRLGEAGGRLVLAGVDGEAALGWGQAHGIGLFAGPFLDRVQAALRMQRCHSASACTLAQCGGRAAALGLPGRAGCGNPALLGGGG